MLEGVITLVAGLRYEKQRQRWRDYMRLISFLVFVAVLLAVLFLQRNAQTAYQVPRRIYMTCLMRYSSYDILA